MAGATEDLLMSNPGVAAPAAEKKPRHMAVADNEEEALNMLEVRDFVATEMTRASLNVMAPFMPEFRILVEPRKSQLAYEDTIELRPLAGHVLTATITPPWGPPGLDDNSSIR